MNMDGETYNSFVLASPMGYRDAGQEAILILVGFEETGELVILLMRRSLSEASSNSNWRWQLLRLKPTWIQHHPTFQRFHQSAQMVQTAIAAYSEDRLTVEKTPSLIFYPTAEDGQTSPKYDTHLENIINCEESARQDLEA
jgi:hypothetical protein